MPSSHLGGWGRGWSGRGSRCPRRLPCFLNGPALGLELILLILGQIPERVLQFRLSRLDSVLGILRHTVCCLLELLLGRLELRRHGLHLVLEPLNLGGLLRPLLPTEQDHLGHGPGQHLVLGSDIDIAAVGRSRRQSRHAH